MWWLYIAISLASQVPAMLIFHTGTQHWSRFIDLSAIAEKQGGIAPSLIGLHSFTRCDSAFSGKCKKPGLVLLKEACHRQAMTDFGKTFNVTPKLMSSAEAFVCSLYHQPKLNVVNKARCKIFCSKGCSTSQLPPCHNALQLHIKRANYQAAVWR